MIREWYLKIVSAMIWLAIASLTLVFGVIAMLSQIMLLSWDDKRRTIHLFGRAWSWCILMIHPYFKLEIQRYGQIDLQRHYIIISNHQSMSDIIAIYITGANFKWIAKQIIFRIPIIGWAMALGGYIPLIRGDKASARACLEKAKEWLGREVSVYLFPEGTRSEDGRIKAFKPGAFKLAIETGTPLLPIALHGCARVLPKKSWVFREKSNAILAIGEPIDPASYTIERLPELSDHCREKIIDLAMRSTGLPRAQVEASVPIKVENQAGATAA